MLNLVSMRAPFLAAVALTGIAAAQTVSPAHFTTAEGPRNFTGPFGQNQSTGWRYLQVHDDMIGTPRTIRGIVLRRDRSANRAYNSYSLRLTMVLSDAATTSTTLDGTFQNNHGANAATVIRDRTITFPSTGLGRVPAPFVYVVPFDTPFQYLGTGPLAWEVQVSSTQGMLTSYSFDAVSSGSTNPPLATANFGQGCRHSTRLSAMSATGSSSMNWPSGVGTLRMNCNDVPESSLISALLGVSDTSLMGTPLPYLLPGSLTAPSGPCILYQNATLSFGVATSNSSVQFALPIPAPPNLHGFRIYGQFIAPDMGAGHPLGVVTSNAVAYNFVAPYGNAPIGNIQATNVFASTGTVRQFQGYVVKFQ